MRLNVSLRCANAGTVTSRLVRSEAWVSRIATNDSARMHWQGRSGAWIAERSGESVADSHKDAEASLSQDT